MQLQVAIQGYIQEISDWGGPKFGSERTVELVANYFSPTPPPTRGKIQRAIH